MLTIDKFEEASEVVKRVTQDTKLIFSDYFSKHLDDFGIFQCF